MVGFAMTAVCFLRWGMLCAWSRLQVLRTDSILSPAPLLTFQGSPTAPSCVNMPCSTAPLLTFQCSHTAPGLVLMFVHTALATSHTPASSLLRPGTMTTKSRCRTALSGGW
eukprot:5194504-Amphidinium_carterae.1